MALVKCKECGKEVSIKAESCPQCGAKGKKKTSIFTWLVLFLIIAAVYGGISGTSTVTKSSDQASSVTSSKPKPTTPKPAAPVPSWSDFESKDEMSGESSAYAYSPKTGPTSRLGFPLQGLTSFIGVGCKKGSQWAYIKFSSAPNLTGDETKDGYNLIKRKNRGQIFL